MKNHISLLQYTIPVATVLLLLVQLTISMPLQAAPDTQKVKTATFAVG